MESYLNPELLNKEHMLDIAHSSSKIFSLSHIVVDLDEVDFRVYNSLMGFFAGLKAIFHTDDSVSY